MNRGINFVVSWSRLFSIAIGSLMFGPALRAEPLVYDGFADGNDEAEGRLGLADDWLVTEGKPYTVTDDLAIGGLDSLGGAMGLLVDSAAINVVEVSAIGDVYGSFRVKVSRHTEDSMIGMQIMDPGASDYRLENALVALLIKGYRRPYSSIVVSGKKSQAEEGTPIVPDATSLVLFQIENSSMSENGKITMWVSSEEQVASLISNGFSREYLNHTELGPDPDQLSQRISAEIPKEEGAIFQSGVVVALVSRYGAKCSFDEIRISSESLADAAGAAGN